VREKSGVCPEFDVLPGGKYAPLGDRRCSSGNYILWLSGRALGFCENEAKFYTW